MKNFIKGFLIFLFPLLIITILIVYCDFYRVFGSYDDYYKQNFVPINREYVCTQLYKRNRERYKFNSFIFGSSRSQAYKCVTWQKCLPKDAEPFHFDASAEGVYGIANKLKYIDSLGDSINNVLIILDRDLLMTTKNRTGHIFVSPPELSGESGFEFKFEFFSASLNLFFLSSYVDYSITKNYKPYMKSFIYDLSKPQPTYNNVNCDIFYGEDRSLRTDSIGYYNSLPAHSLVADTSSFTCKVTPEELTELTTIKQILDKHKTNYRIVISPVFDKIAMEDDQLALLDKLFGKENIYNFSGINPFTKDIRNYYEANHYKPYVAEKIMDLIYGYTQN